MNKQEKELLIALLKGNGFNPTHKMHNPETGKFMGYVDQTGETITDPHGKPLYPAIFIKVEERALFRHWLRLLSSPTIACIKSREWQEWHPKDRKHFDSMLTMALTKVSHKGESSFISFTEM